MKITLRKRNQGGKTSLFLDFTINGKRTKEYLQLYLDEENPTKLQKETNKLTMELAETIRSQRQIEIQNGTYGFINPKIRKADFVTYFSDLKEKRFESRNNYDNWDAVEKHLKAFAPNGLTFEQLSVQKVQEFRDYLDKKAKTKSSTGLSQNSKHSYFNKFKAALKQAHRDSLILDNPGERVEGFKMAESQREFLTLEELQLVARTDCEFPILKTAFLFSCLSGLRWSDINKLTWSEVQHSNEMGYYVRFRQQKTKGIETLPISEQAFNLLGDRGNQEDRVFIGLKYSAWHNLKLQQWMMAAGIHRTITFHCARHTYATLQLSLGTDIYTVSKMLGHRELRTTQIYAKVIDDKKKEAANKIDLGF
jgi:integrase